MNNGFFITGTDTGVGKTLISCAIIHALKQRGHRVIGMKPVAAGAENAAQGLYNADALQLIEASQTSLPYELINPFCYAPPIAPHIAAQEIKRPINLEKIQHCYEVLQREADYVIVEGAGGWLVPMNENQTLADLAIALALPVILVVDIRLGCLNHALLSQQAIKHAKLPLVGWVANITQPNNSRSDENIDYLKKSINCPLIGIQPYQRDLNYKLLAKILTLPD